MSGCEKVGGLVVEASERSASCSEQQRLLSEQKHGKVAIGRNEKDDKGIPSKESVSMLVMKG